MTRPPDPAAGDPRPGLRARRALITVVAGVGLVLVAYVFDAAPLFVPGLSLIAVGATAPLWVLATGRGARVRRVIGVERVVEDEPLQATIEVRRPFALAGWAGLEALDPLTGARLRLGGSDSPLRRSRAARIRVTARLAPRGEHRIAPPTLIAADVLELAQYRTRGDGAVQTVLVLPRTESVHWLVGAGTAARLRSGAGASHGEALAATELDGLRPYRVGTPASRIHWPAVARGRGLIERRLHADGDRRPLVILDARTHHGLRGDRSSLDAAVRATASLVLDLARRGGCGLLLPGQARPLAIDSELAGWPDAHARLAVVGAPGTGGGDVSLRPPAVTAGGLRGGPVVYVTAASHERLAQGLQGPVGAGGVTLVVPDAELVDGRPRGVAGRVFPVLEVSGCRGFALGARRPAGSAGRPEGDPVRGR